MSWASTMTPMRPAREIVCVMQQGGAPARTAGAMRPRDFGLSFGSLPTGRTNTIVDVGDLRVGHATVHDDDRGVHTGVTAILNDELAAGLPLPAALYVGNGYGKLVGATQIETTGQIETPVMLTSTLSTFRVADHLITWMQGRRATALRSINPVVGEINDTWLSAPHDYRLDDEAVFEALNSASHDIVAGGNVGGGAGACALGFKAGIGSASRRLRIRGEEHHLGVLIQANMTGELRLHGGRVTPQSLGLPVAGPATEEGSCIVVVAVDFPCSPARAGTHRPACGLRPRSRRRGIQSRERRLRDQPLHGRSRRAAPATRGPRRAVRRDSRLRRRRRRGRALRCGHHRPRYRAGRPPGSRRRIRRGGPAVKMPPSRLGVLGGMGPMATAYFFERLIAATSASTDQEHIPVVIWSDGRVPDRTDALLGRGPSPVPAMNEGWHALKNAGADLIAIPCNTAHAFLSEIDTSPGRGFVDMIAATVDTAAALSSGRVGLFATRGTRMSGLYDRAAEERGLDLVHVDEDEQENLIDKAIRILKGGERSDAAERLIEEATRSLATSGCDVVMAACTEIPLASGRASQVLPVVDSVACLADACVEAFSSRPDSSAASSEGRFR